MSRAVRRRVVWSVLALGFGAGAFALWLDPAVAHGVLAASLSGWCG